MAVDPNFFDDLVARGLIQDTTDEAALRARLLEGPITVYCGFDPTATSLHIGNMIPLLTLCRFQNAGHNVLSLAGGATGMIGDPSGKSDERNLLDDADLDRNLEGIKPQLSKFLRFDGDNPAELVDNRDWVGPLTYLDFLREVGKYITVNQMVAKDSVRTRMSSENGISYTEFSYMLVQGYDFFWLNQNKNCEMQIGGSDQWGNITVGADLIRKKVNGVAHCLSFPLLLKPDGTKYGKTAGGETPWLDAELFSPYKFYQYWLQVDDTQVRDLLLRLTLIPVDEIDKIVAEHEAEPHKRIGQRRFAFEITSIVHGAQEATKVEKASEVVFGGNVEDLSLEAFETLSREIPYSKLPRFLIDQEDNLIDVLLNAKVVESKSEANRLLSQNGVSVNGTKLSPTDYIGEQFLLHERYVLLRKGKKSVVLLDFAPES